MPYCFLSLCLHGADQSSFLKNYNLDMEPEGNILEAADLYAVLYAGSSWERVKL